MSIERVCVVGGGVIGSLYAAHLAQRVETWVLTRRAAQSEALAAHGLRHSDAHVEYELDTETWLGPYAGTTTFEHVQEVERLLLDSGLHARAFPDLRPAQWSKLVFNATVNTVAALTDLPHVGAFAR